METFITSSAGINMSKCVTKRLLRYKRKCLLEVVYQLGHKYWCDGAFPLCDNQFAVAHFHFNKLFSFWDVFWSYEARNAKGTGACVYMKQEL